MGDSFAYLRLIRKRLYYWRIGHTIFIIGRIGDDDEIEDRT
jgi:hypothetical protein